MRVCLRVCVQHLSEVDALAGRVVGRQQSEDVALGGLVTDVLVEVEVDAVLRNVDLRELRVMRAGAGQLHVHVTLHRNRIWKYQVTRGSPWWIKLVVHR